MPSSVTARFTPPSTERPAPRSMVAVPCPSEVAKLKLPMVALRSPTTCWPGVSPVAGISTTSPSSVVVNSNGTCDDLNLRAEVGSYGVFPVIELLLTTLDGGLDGRCLLFTLRKWRRRRRGRRSRNRRSGRHRRGGRSRRRQLREGQVKDPRTPSLKPWDGLGGYQPEIQDMEAKGLAPANCSEVLR